MQGVNVVHALRDVNLEIKQRSFHAIMGASGCGKTTLLNIIGLLLPATSGRLFIEGKDVSGLDEKHANKYRMNMGKIFQAFYLLPALTALENVSFALSPHGIPKKERITRAKEMLARVGLSDRMDHKIQMLSGGQQQRVAIARALVVSPSIILADEPTGNVDEETGEKILDLLKELHANYDLTILLVTHNHEIGNRIGRLLLMRDGRIVSGGD